jgi:hypothetical protein
MNIKNKAREVARQSKSCRIEGGGHIIMLYADGSLQVGTTPGTIGRHDETGKAEYPLVRWQCPITAREAEIMIRRAIAEKAQRGGTVREI